MACGGRRRAHGVGEELGRAAASRRKRRSRGSCTREGEEGGARYHAGDVLCASGFMATAGGVQGGAVRLTSVSPVGIELQATDNRIN